MQTEGLIIIGAGVAGLVLARRLKQAGRDVPILEARPRVGGRTDAFDRDGATFDLGATWIWEPEHAVRGLVDELGLTTYPSHRGGLDLFETAHGIERVRLPGSAVAEYRVDGGTAAISRALAQDLAVQLSTPVRELAFRGDGVHVVLDDQTLRANAIVWAAPPALLGTAVGVQGMAADELQTLGATPVWMGDMAKVVAHYGEPFWLGRGLSGRVFSQRGPMVEIHDLSGRVRDTSAALFGFVPRTDGDWVAAAREQLERLFGPRAAAPTAFEVKAWWEEPETTPPKHRPIPQLLGHPFLRRPFIDGRLHLASTETAASGAGHLDGAVGRAHALATWLDGLDHGPA